MEKTAAYILILLSAIVIYGLSQNYVGQVSRSNPGIIASYGEGTGQPIYVAPAPPLREPVRQEAVYAPSRPPRTLTMTGNTTNQTNHTACVSNTCTVVSGPGPNQCWPQGSFCGLSVAPALLIPLNPPGCTDTDKQTYPTINYFLKGTATVTWPNSQQFSQTDICNFTAGPNVLTERFCTTANTLYIVSYNINCAQLVNNMTQFNMTCSNGRCI